MARKSPKRSSSVLVLELPLSALKAPRGKKKSTKRRVVKARVQVKAHSRKAPRKKAKR